MPVLICLREKLWTRTYYIGDQVPTCPVFTRAKIKVPFWDFSQFRVAVGFDFCLYLHSQRIRWTSFSRTYPALCIYQWSVWSNFSHLCKFRVDHLSYRFIPVLLLLCSLFSLFEFFFHCSIDVANTCDSLQSYQGCPRGVMVKAMDCGIVVSEFVLQSRYYIHFWANTLGKGMYPLILPAMG